METLEAKQHRIKQREDYTTKIFKEGFKMIFVFGAPAFLGAFLGTKLDAHYNTGRLITIGMLIFTFIFSWIIVIISYKKLQKEAEKLKNNS